MTVQLDNAEITLKLNVDDALKADAKAGKKIKESEAKRKREGEKEQSRQRGRFGANAKGAALDVVRGRVPGAGRFGKAAMKVAGIMGVLIAIEELGPVVSGLIPGSSGIIDPIAIGIGKGRGEISARFKALEETRNVAMAAKLAGKDPSEAELTDFFNKGVEVHRLMDRPERLKKFLTQKEVGPVLRDAMLPLMRDLLLEMTNDPTASLIFLGPIQTFVRNMIRDELNQAPKNGLPKGGVK